MALEVWEIVVIVVIMILVLKPSIVINVARSLGGMFGEHKKGKSAIANRQGAKILP